MWHSDTKGRSTSDLIYSDGMLLNTLMLLARVIQGGAEASWHCKKHVTYRALSSFCATLYNEYIQNSSSVQVVHRYSALTNALYMCHPRCVYIYRRNTYFKKSQHNLVFGVFIIQADDMFRLLFSGHPQVTWYITFEEAIQCKYDLHCIAFSNVIYPSIHPPIHPSIHLWRYSPFRALAPLTRRLHSSLFAALLLHPLVPSSCSAMFEHSMYRKSVSFPCNQVVVYLLIPSEASLRFSEHRFFSRVGSLPPRPTPNLED